MDSHIMTSYYEVLRPAAQADLDASPRFAKVLELIPREGYVTLGRFMHLGRKSASGGMTRACAVGILKRVPPYARIMKLDSVKFWCTQINDSGHRNTPKIHNTRRLYLGSVARLDEWLRGRTFPSYEQAPPGSPQARQAVAKSFENVEDLAQYCMESDIGTWTAQRAMREYLASPGVSGTSASMQAITRSAIKSYFNAHDVVLNLPKAKKQRAGPPQDDVPPMSLEDFYRMLQTGNPGIMMRTIILIALQSGIDASTFTDCFNHEGYPQLVKHFKTADYSAWDLDACPVPIKMVRVKTDRQYTTFIDRDAVDQLKKYLAWKEAKHGRQDASKPLFMTKQNTPIHPMWLSTNFSKVAIRAGIQEKVSARVFKMRAHAVRHLLKSTLKASGCAAYVADHVLGHAPRDAYEKEAILYPEEMRKEYAKASSRLNIISKVESNLNNPEDPASQEARIRELEAEVAALKQAKAGDNLAGGERNDAMNGMSEKMNHILRLFDTLPDDIKERMSDELGGAD